MKKSNLLSGRLFASNKHAPACLFRQSPNANGSAESRSALGSLYSRQHHSQTLCVCSVMFSWTFAVAPLAAAPRLLKGRSVGKALPHFHSEPYVTLHPRRGFAYIRHFALRAANTFLLRTANARQRRAHQSNASAPSFSRLGAKFPLTP